MWYTVVYTCNKVLQSKRGQTLYFRIFWNKGVAIYRFSTTITRIILSEVLQPKGGKYCILEYSGIKELPSIAFQKHPKLPKLFWVKVEVEAGAFYRVRKIPFFLLENALKKNFCL